MALTARRSIRSTSKVLGVFLATSLVAAGCGSSDTGDNGDNAGGDGVAFGATKAEYVKALSSMEPITLTMPSVAAKGEPNSWWPEAYAKAVNEWSGGKMTVDIAYGNSVADLVTAGEALADGRLDISYFTPIYDPDNYPANNLASSITFAGPRTSLVGRMVQNAAAAELAVNTPELSDEITDAGIVPILPLSGAGSTVGILCTDEKHNDSLKGAQVRVTGQSHMPGLEAMGATPVSLPMLEIFQGLQRGVIDCAEGLLSVLAAVGATEVAPNWALTQDQPGVGFPSTPTAFGANPQTWAKLPLAAQQLLFDRYDVYLDGMLRSEVFSEAGAVTKLKAAGGNFTSWSDATNASLKAINDKTLKTTAKSDLFKDGSAAVDGYMTAIDEWTALVTEDLGFGDSDPVIEDLDTWIKDNGDPDFGPFVDEFMSKIMQPHRPGNS